MDPTTFRALTCPSLPSLIGCFHRLGWLGFRLWGHIHRINTCLLFASILCTQRQKKKINNKKHSQLEAKQICILASLGVQLWWTLDSIAAATTNSKGGRVVDPPKGLQTSKLEFIVPHTVHSRIQHGRFSVECICVCVTGAWCKRSEVGKG